MQNAKCNHVGIIYSILQIIQVLAHNSNKKKLIKSVIFISSYLQKIVPTTIADNVQP